MVVGTIGAIANGLCMPLMTVISGQLLNTFGDSNKVDVAHQVGKVAVKFFYLAIGSAVAAFLQVSSWMVTGERQAARIRGLYLRTILRQDIAFFDTETSTGEIIGRMSGDTILIQDAMGEKVGKFIQLISTFLGGFVIAFVKGWLLSLIMLSCIPPMAITASVLSIFISKMSSRGHKAYAEAGNIVEQTIGSIRTVVSFTGEKKAITKYNESLRTAYKSTVQQGLVTGLGISIALLIVFCSFGLAVWYGSKLIIRNSYNGGQVFNIMIAIAIGGTSLGQASPSVKAFAAGRAAAYKMFETIERKPEIDAYNKKGIVLKNIKGDIKLNKVYFSYPARPDVQVFSGFSLHVPSGATAALVGESGSGKSTVISLVERFYDPQAGHVLIDGINLKKLRLGWIREKIGLVSQEPILFMTSIRDNIAYGKEGATLEEIKSAIELANAARFIDKLPEGLDTMVGEHGTQLSGGQKQRIAIARAILKNPKILLLDEATSALDSESEYTVQEALVSSMVNRTVLVVAHRLSTVRNADMIAVVHQGKIVEQGSHSELIKYPDGAYSHLISLQELNNHAREMSPMDPYKDYWNFYRSNVVGNSPNQNFSPMRPRERESSSWGRTNHVSISPLPRTSEFLEGGQVGEKGDEHDEIQQEVSLGRLAYLNKPELPVLLLGTVAASTHGMIFPFFGTFLSSSLTTFYEPQHKLQKDCSILALKFMGLGMIALIAITMQQYLFGVAGGKLIRRICSSSFERVVHQEIGWFDEPINSSGAIGARLSSNASTLRNLVGDALALMVQNIAAIIAGLTIAMLANWRLALVILALIPMVGLQGYVQTLFLKGFTADTKVASQVASDAVGSIRTVASFCAEQKVMDLYKKKCDAPMKRGVRQGIISGFGFGFSFFVLFSTYAISFYTGAVFVGDGKATFSQVFRVFLVLTMAAIAVSQASALAPDGSKAKYSAASIFAILDRESKIDSSNTKGGRLRKVRGDIEFQHVKFRYPIRPDVHIFRDLCLRIPSRKTVALVGESGCGKSTVIALLQRFYDPDSGRILLDGKEIQNLRLTWLRQQMGLVSQEPILFNETIRDNIAYGKQEKANEDEIIGAAEAANAHRFISALPQGYDTNVGERGVQLSGGQKQRIAIARAILKDPKILLLDEATSALDAESERVVQEALDRVKVTRTTIVVAHRLSTIKGVDTIAVVKDGVIAEKGRHENLIKMRGGIYASLLALHRNSSVV
ncbi:ABC transporter B family member 11-like [Tasmannia lanceolata]|uniref:ABC transporter B family member 11-like n=1 Tax=Tasmannia lanceolata TaxID=3420 RepID=UPI004063715D